VHFPHFRLETLLQLLLRPGLLANCRLDYQPQS
jgi:hypothetical protein